jgi:hypothetical protein
LTKTARFLCPSLPFFNAGFNSWLRSTRSPWSCAASRPPVSRSMPPCRCRRPRATLGACASARRRRPGYARSLRGCGCRPRPPRSCCGRPRLGAAQPVSRWHRHQRLGWQLRRACDGGEGAHDSTITRAKSFSSNLIPFLRLFLFSSIYHSNRPIYRQNRPVYRYFQLVYQSK